MALPETARRRWRRARLTFGAIVGILFFAGLLLGMIWAVALVVYVLNL